MTGVLDVRPRRFLVHFIFIGLCCLLLHVVSAQDEVERESESSPENPSSVSETDTNANENLEADESDTSQKSSDDTPEESSNGTTEEDSNSLPEKEKEDEFAHLPPFERYKKLFIKHRESQMRATMGIVTLSTQKMGANLVQLLLQKLFQTLSDAQQNLTAINFMPGDPFPEDDDMKEVFSKVIENTAMFGDIILYIPEMVHSLYDRNKEWHRVLKWAYHVSKQSGFHDETQDKLLYLVTAMPSKSGSRSHRVTIDYSR